MTPFVGNHRCLAQNTVELELVWLIERKVLVALIQRSLPGEAGGEGGGEVGGEVGGEEVGGEGGGEASSSIANLTSSEMAKFSWGTLSCLGGPATHGDSQTTRLSSPAALVMLMLRLWPE